MFLFLIDSFNAKILFCAENQVKFVYLESKLKLIMTIVFYNKKYRYEFSNN
jgi:hypothetical protein